jgi:hypothetical protein
LTHVESFVSGGLRYLITVIGGLENDLWILDDMSTSISPDESLPKRHLKTVGLWSTNICEI